MATAIRKTAAPSRKRVVKGDSDFLKFEARVPSHIKSALEEAAYLQGLSQTDFMVSAISDAANRVIRENNVIQLSLQDQKTIVAALQKKNPSVRKCEKLRQAIRRSREMAGGA